jgi:alginate O-acetyltransferase complex protein AlgI
LGKKVLIANTLGVAADAVFAASGYNLPIMVVWVGVLSYTLQLYFDFSGYSDMAIGLGAMLGFKFQENFNYPYIAHSITDFWKRWHISLTSFMREYLYIPLGGNRRGSIRTYMNVWVVFILSGLWHGASSTFIFWGIYHGFFIMLDRMYAERLMSKVPKFFRVISTFLVVMVGWVFFRSDSLYAALAILSNMFGIANGNPQTYMIMADFIGHRTWFVLFLGIFISFIPIRVISHRIRSRIARLSISIFKV